jgi:hypothetical protein
LPVWPSCLPPLNQAKPTRCGNASCKTRLDADGAKGFVQPQQRRNLPPERQAVLDWNSAVRRAPSIGPTFTTSPSIANRKRIGRPRRGACSRQCGRYSSPYGVPRTSQRTEHIVHPFDARFAAGFSQKPTRARSRAPDSILRPLEKLIPLPATRVMSAVLGTHRFGAVLIVAARNTPPLFLPPLAQSVPG